MSDGRHFARRVEKNTAALQNVQAAVFLATNDRAHAQFESAAVQSRSADGRLTFAGFLAGSIRWRLLAAFVVTLGHLAVFVIAMNRVLRVFDVAARAGCGCLLLLFAAHETLPPDKTCR
jgi:hypothetical protein